MLLFAGPGWLCLKNRILHYRKASLGVVLSPGVPRRGPEFLRRVVFFTDVACAVIEVLWQGLISFGRIFRCSVGFFEHTALPLFLQPTFGAIEARDA